MARKISKKKRLQKYYQKAKGFIDKIAPHFVIISLFVLIICVYLWPMIFISVKPGQSAVLWQRFAGGTIVDQVYGEGFHVIPPWDKMYIYNIRYQEVPDSIQILTNNGLTLHIDLSIRYHPQAELLGLLHKHIGENYVEVLILPEVRSVVRREISLHKPEEIYTTQKAIAERVVSEAARQLGERYVTLDDVLIKRIVLPESIKTAIEAKLTAQQLALEYDFRLEKEEKEAERKRIEATGIRNYNRLVNEMLTPDLLKWQGIVATKELAQSNNAKIVVIGAGEEGLPLILGN